MSEPQGPRITERSLMAAILVVTGATGIHGVFGGGIGEHGAKIFEQLAAIRATVNETKLELATLRATSTQEAVEFHRRLERLEGSGKR